MSLAAALGLVAALWLTLFQALLAAGAPLGALAWGGQTRGRLAARARWASLASALFGALVAAAFAQAAGFWQPLPAASLVPLLAASAGLFALSTLANLASKSRPERLHGTPLAAVLAVTSAVVALALSGG